MDTQQHKYYYLKSYKSSNLKKNKIQIQDAKVILSIEHKFTEEMRLFINFVIGKDLEFLHNYKNDKGMNIIIRVNKEIAAYGRIEYGTIERVTNNDLIMDTSFHANRICVLPSLQGNGFYKTIFLMMIKYAYENNYKSISCLIGIHKVPLQEIVKNLGFIEIYKILNVPIGWDNFKSNGDCKVFKYTVSDHSLIKTNQIDDLIQQSFNNSNRINFNNNLKIFTSLKSKL